MNARAKARIAGVLYLVVFVAVYALFTRDGMIVAGDAGATASNIRQGEFRFRLAFVADLVSAAAYIGVTGLLYELLKPVSRTLSLLAALFGLAGASIMAMNMMSHMAPLYWLGDAEYLNALESSERETIARVSLRVQGLGYNIAGLFFAVHLLLLGWLVANATFLPRVLGILLVIAAAAYFFNIFSIFLAPAFALQLYPYILLPGFVGEASFTLWLTAMGVDEKKWRAQAEAPR
jgi:hypothetical protein